MPETPDAPPGTTDLTDALRRYGEALEAGVTPSVADRSAPHVVGTRERPGPGRPQLAIAAVVVLLLAVAIGVLALRPDDATVQIGGPAPTGGSGGSGGAGGTGTSGPSTSPTGSWEQLPASPLSPRSNALALTVGDEVFVIGGDDRRPCAARADCALDPKPPLQDGAAYSLKAKTWRKVADAPFALATDVAVVAGDRLYVKTGPVNQGASTLLSYDTVTDRWAELPQEKAPAPMAIMDLDVVGDELVALLAPSTGGTDRTLSRFVVRENRWAGVPAPARPLGAEVSLAGVGDGIVVFDADQAANNSTGPRLTRAQVFDVATSSWTVLPDSEVLAGNGEWHAIRPGGGGPRLLVNLSLGSADGGRVNNFGRSYPYGGTLDVDTGVWAPLPDPPSSAEQGSEPFLTGSSSDGEWVAHDGWAFEAWLGRWVPIDSPNGAPTEAPATTWVDGKLIVWGGVVWDSSTEAHHSADGWLWTPPDPKALAGPSAEPAAEPAAPTTVGTSSSPKTSGSAVPCTPVGTLGADGSDAIVFLNPNATAEQIDDVRARLTSRPDIDSATYVDQAAAYEEFRVLFASQPDLIADIEPQDLPSSYRLLMVDTVGADTLARLVVELGSVPGVKDVVVQPWPEGCP